MKLDWKSLLRDEGRMKYLLILLLAAQLIQGQEGPPGWDQIPSNANRIYGRGSAEIRSNQLSDARVKSRDAAYAEILSQFKVNIQATTQTLINVQSKVSEDSQGKRETRSIGDQNSSAQTRSEVSARNIPGLVIDSTITHKDSDGILRVYTRCYLDKTIAIDSLSRMSIDIASEVRTLALSIKDHSTEDPSALSVTAGLRKCSVLQKQIIEARDLNSFLAVINPDRSIFDSLLSSEDQINKIIHQLKKGRINKWIFYSNVYKPEWNAEAMNPTAAEIFSIVASVIKEEGGVWREEGSLYRFEIVQMEEETPTLKGVSPNDFYEANCSLTLKVVQVVTKEEINLPSFNALGRGGSIPSARENLKKDIRRRIRSALNPVYTSFN